MMTKAKVPLYKHDNVEIYRLHVRKVQAYAVVLLSPDGEVQSWNEGAEEILGYSEQEIIGKHFSVLFSEDPAANDLIEARFDKAKKLGRYIENQTLVKKDGSTFYAYSVLTALNDKEGVLKGYSQIVQDLTDKKEAEERLRLSEERYRLLVEGVKDYAIFMLSPEGYIQSWNEGAKRIKGYSSNEIIGKHFSVFYPKEAIDSKYPEFELEQAALLGKFEDEGYRIKKDGTMFFANVLITALYGPDKKLIGYSKVTRDLTDKKLAEEKLLFNNQQLEQKVKDRTEELTKTVQELKLINADLDNFVYTASHDLKAPVSNIEGLVETLKDILSQNGFLTKEVESVIDMIGKSIFRFQNTIKDLASISEIHKSANDLMEIDMYEIVEDIMAGIDHLIKESEAQIDISIENPKDFKFSRIHMRSLIYNFLNNAIKYRSPERPLQVKLTARKESDDFVITISDNGLGIKKGQQDKIFNLFQRLHKQVEGTGIGLYIVKRIVDSVGGRVEVASIEGQGTTFAVYLPIR